MAKRLSKGPLNRRSVAAKIVRKSQPKAERPFAPGYGIVDPEAGEGLMEWAWVGKKMNSCRTFWLTTIHADRPRPHVMPVWGVWFEDTFFFSTGRKSRKGKNLAANGACTITNDDGEEAVIVEGLATEVENEPESARVAAAYEKKYKIDPRGMGEPIFRVSPNRVFGLVEKSFPLSATRWKL